MIEKFLLIKTGFLDSGANLFNFVNQNRKAAAKVAMARDVI